MSEQRQMYPNDEYQSPEEIAKAFKAFFSEIENSRCFDCSAQAGEWISVNNGISLCEKCADLHRTFGEHISMVRSANSPEWLESELNMLRNGGNRKLRDFFSEYEFDPTEPRIFKYKTLAAFWYRKKLRHYVEGKQDPVKPPKETHMQQLENEGLLDSIVEKFSKLGGMISNVFGVHKSEEEIPTERGPKDLYQQKPASFMSRSFERMKSGVQTAVDYIKDKAVAALDSDEGEEIPIHTEETTEGHRTLTKAQSLEDAVAQLEKEEKSKGIVHPSGNGPIPNLETPPSLSGPRSSSVVENLEDVVAEFEVKEELLKDKPRQAPATDVPKWKFPIKKKKSPPKVAEQPKEKKEEKKGGIMEAVTHAKDAALGLFNNALKFVKDQAQPKDRPEETTITTTTTKTTTTAEAKPTEQPNLNVFDWDEVRWDSPKIKKLFEKTESNKIAQRAGEERKEGNDFMREKFGNW